MMSDGLTLDVKRAAALIGQTEAFVRRLIADEQVTAQKFRGRWIVTRQSLLDWVNAGGPSPHRPAPLSVVPGVVRPKGQRAA